MKKRKFINIFAIILLVLFIGIINVEAKSFLEYNNTVSCGNINNIPSKVPEIMSTLIDVVQIVVPILLVIFGAIDLAKGIMAQKEDEIKKGQQTFIKRVVVGAIIFLIVILVKFLVNLVSQGSEQRNSIVECVNCFVNNECSGSTTE